jgi:four helix bundle protein
MKSFFAHERLEAYQQSLEFVRWSETIWRGLPKSVSVVNQLDRARTSIPLNIAEGNGKATPADKGRFFDTAHGSALECAACLDVLLVFGAITESDWEAGKETLCRVVGLLVGLIKSKMPDHWLVKEDSVGYRVNRNQYPDESKPEWE